MLRVTQVLALCVVPAAVWLVGADTPALPSHIAVRGHWAPLNTTPSAQDRPIQWSEPAVEHERVRRQASISISGTSTSTEIDNQVALVSTATTLSSVSVLDSTIVTNTQLRTLFAAVTSVAGSIDLQRLPVTELTMPALRTVSGNLQITLLSNLVTLTVPNLLSVDGDLTVNTVVVSTMSFVSLTRVGGAMLMRTMDSLSGAEFSGAFASLETVGGALSVVQVSRLGTLARTTAVLPALRTTGGLTVHYIGCRVFSCPVLTTIAGRFTIDFNFHTVNFDLPVLTRITGQVVVTRNAVLSNLCGFPSLGPAGYTASLPISIPNSNPHLSQMPLWIAQNASLSGTVQCSPVNPIFIGSQSEYQGVVQDTTLMSLTEVGSVIITWAGLVDAELDMLLGRRAVIGELVIEGCASLVNVSTALDNVVNVSTRLVFENLTALNSAILPRLERIGGGLWVANCQRFTTIGAPRLQTIGGSIHFNQNPVVQVAAFESLARVGGTMFLRSMSALSGIALANGFNALHTVGGLVSLIQISRSGGNVASTISLPALESAGGLSIHFSLSARASFPLLGNLSGTLTFDLNTNMRTVDLPRLFHVGGGLIVTRMTALTNLCGFPLLPSVAQSVTIGSGQPQLTRMPEWVATSAALSSSTPCSPTAPITASPTASVQPTGAPFSSIPTRAPSLSTSTAPTFTQPTPSTGPMTSPSPTAHLNQTATPTAAVGAGGRGDSRTSIALPLTIVAVAIVIVVVIFVRHKQSDHTPGGKPSMVNPLYHNSVGESGSSSSDSAEVRSMPTTTPPVRNVGPAPAPPERYAVFNDSTTDSALGAEYATPGEIKCPYNDCGPKFANGPDAVPSISTTYNVFGVVQPTANEYAVVNYAARERHESVVVAQNGATYAVPLEHKHAARNETDFDSLHQDMLTDPTGLPRRPLLHYDVPRDVEVTYGDADNHEMQQHVGYDMPLTDAQAAVIPLSEVSQQYAIPQQCEEHYDLAPPRVADTNPDYSQLKENEFDMLHSAEMLDSAAVHSTEQGGTIDSRGSSNV